MIHSLVLEQAVVPEHSVPFMEAVSGGTAFVEDDHLFLAADDWLTAVGYPLCGVYTHERFEAALSAALARTGAVRCWAAAPDLPPRLCGHCIERDVYYMLDAGAPPPARLRGPLRRAGELLRVEEGRTFTAQHRRLWAEFMGRTALRPMVRQLFARTEAALAAPGADLRLLNAWDREGRLAACLLLDFTPRRFCSYLIGAHSRTHYTPHASDLLFAAMSAAALREGRHRIHLGLGVNDGIRRFKHKWGGVPELPFRMARWEEQRAATVGSRVVDGFVNALLKAPADRSKRQILAELPEQRPFAMLWELEKNGRTSWIGGTAHFFCCSFSRSLARLFERADTVLFEGPLDRDSLAEVERLGRSPDPDAPRLIERLNETEIRRLERVVCGPTGLPARLLNIVHPNPADVRGLLGETRHWFAFFSLWTAFLERRGWRESVDLEAWNLALDMGRTVVGMESLDEQTASLEAVPLSRAEAFLRNCGTWSACARRNVRAYLAGDLEGMLGTSTEFPTRTEQIIGRRDARFLERMLPYVEQGRTVVFVGAAHMLNLRRMLAEEGFRIRKVLPTWKHALCARLRGGEL